MIYKGEQVKKNLAAVNYGHNCSRFTQGGFKIIQHCLHCIAFNVKCIKSQAWCCISSPDLDLKAHPAFRPSGHDTVCKPLASVIQTK